MKGSLSVSKTLSLDPAFVPWLLKKTKPYDWSRLRRFRIADACTKKDFDGEYNPPRRVVRREYGAEIKVHVNSKTKFPFLDDLNDVIVELVDTTEIVVVVAAHEIAHHLRTTKQIKGNDTEESAEEFAAQWLKDWRTR